MNTLSDSRCVVLGGGGFIGTNLCRSLVDKVHTLRAFGRRQSFPDALKGVDWIPGDFTDASAVAGALTGCDTVFHLVTATTPASSNVDKVGDVRSNVIATLQLLDACKELGVKRVIFISSGGTIYGIPEKVPTPEDAPLNPITAYGISKLSIEKYLALYEHLYGIEYRVLRVANPYGPYQTALRNQGVIAAFVHRALAHKPIEIWGDGTVTRDYVYIDDVVEALELAAGHSGKERIFNIGSGEGRSLNEIIANLEQQLGHTLDVNRREGRAVDVPCSVLDVSRAAADLGWRPKTGFAEGLAHTLRWYEGLDHQNS